MLVDDIILDGHGSRTDLGDVDSLAASIERVGLLHPIVVDADGRLVAGERRLEACRRLGKRRVPVTVVDNLTELADILIARRDENACRKPLTPSEAVALGRIMEPLAKADAAKRVGGRPSRKQPQTEGKLPSVLQGRVRDALGVALGMSGRSYEKARAVVSAAEEDPEAFGNLVAEMDRAGKVDHAYKLLRRVQQRREAIRRAEASPVLPEGIHVTHGDFAEQIKELPDNSVSLIFCDPPYDSASDPLPIYEKLAQEGARVLVPGGSLMCYAERFVLFDVQPLMRKHLTYWWLCGVRHTGKRTMLRVYRVVVNMKMLLWFTRGHRRRDTHPIADLVDSTPPDKGLHPWAQSTTEAGYFIEHLTQPGELVADPFCGSGTTLIAGAKLGRRAWGCESDLERYQFAIARLGAEAENEGSASATAVALSAG
jgi:ParB-like chromosome segregation protein Spo0J